jgi:hypothetical protein
MQERYAGTDVGEMQRRVRRLKAQRTMIEEVASPLRMVWTG